MITQTTHLASAEPCGQYPERGVIMAELLFADLPAEAAPRFRQARKGKRWVKEERYRWVYPTIDLPHYPYIVRYQVEVFVTVDLPPDNPPIEWDL